MPRSLRVVLATAALALLLALQADPAWAARTWCRRDPVFRIGTQIVVLHVSSDKAMFDAATGPVVLGVTGPAGVTNQLLATDNGFGYGYAVTAQTAGTLAATDVSLPVMVDAYAPATDAALPVEIDIVPRGRGLVRAGMAQGLANNWIVLQTG